MQLIKQSIAMIALLFLCGSGLWSCASSPFLKVHYQLPDESESLKDITVFLSFNDTRRNKAILSQPAREDLRDFSGNFTLVIGGQNTPEKLLGVYNLASLVKEIFTQRLQHSGIEVVENPNGPAEIEIVLKEFRLDLQSRNWIFSMNYQINLVKDDKLMASESISGTAERLKTVGARDAEKVISELATDMVNKLDVAAFFRQAGL